MIRRGIVMKIWLRVQPRHQAQIVLLCEAYAAPKAKKKDVPKETQHVY